MRGFRRSMDEADEVIDDRQSLSSIPISCGETERFLDKTSTTSDLGACNNIHGLFLE